MSLPISLALFCKNNEDSIYLTFESVKYIVNEIIVLDTGSTDRTMQIAKDYKARVYQVGFTDFGNIRTITMQLAKEPWILGLDTDETLNYMELSQLEELMKDDEVDGWGLPRRRWNDLAMIEQLEMEAYPDYQYRFIRNKPYLYYANRVHERLDGARKTDVSPNGPHIEHFQDVFKVGKRLKERNDLYRRLYDMDVLDGVQASIPPVAELDIQKENKVIE